jgi:hypothetical protein
VLKRLPHVSMFVNLCSFGERWMSRPLNKSSDCVDSIAMYAAFTLVENLLLKEVLAEGCVTQV